MTVLLSNFWNNFDACPAQIRAERIAQEKVTTLRPDISAEDRAHFALIAQEDALSQLEMVADAALLGRRFMDRLSDADTRLSLLRPGLQMKRSLVHLTSSSRAARHRRAGHQRTVRQLGIPLGPYLPGEDHPARHH